MQAYSLVQTNGKTWICEKWSLTHFSSSSFTAYQQNVYTQAQPKPCAKWLTVLAWECCWSPPENSTCWFQFKNSEALAKYKKRMGWIVCLEYKHSKSIQENIPGHSSLIFGVVCEALLRNSPRCLLDAVRTFIAKWWCPLLHLELARLVQESWCHSCLPGVPITWIKNTKFGSYNFGSNWSGLFEESAWHTVKVKHWQPQCGTMLFFFHSRFVGLRAAEPKPRSVQARVSPNF